MLDIRIESKIYDDMPKRNQCFADCSQAILTIDNVIPNDSSCPAEFKFNNLREVDQFCVWLYKTCEQEFYRKASKND